LGTKTEIHRLERSPTEAQAFLGYHATAEYHRRQARTLTLLANSTRDADTGGSTYEARRRTYRLGGRSVPAA
jgi:hypothetical protein